MSAPVAHEIGSSAKHDRKNGRELTDKITRPVLRQAAFRPGGWRGSPSALLLLFGFNIAVGDAFLLWRRYLGHPRCPTAWGFAIVNFVWWIGIGHAGHLHFRSAAPRASAMADQHQPLHRGDDPFRRRVRRDISDFAPGPAVGLFIGCCPIRTRSISGRSFAVRYCGMSSPSALTPLVSLLFWYLGLVPDLAALRDRAPHRWQQIDLWCHVPRLARLHPPLGPLPEIVPAPRGTWPRRSSSRSTASSASTSPSPSCPVGIRRSSRPTL